MTDGHSEYTADDVTPPDVYKNRRKFIQAGVAGGTIAATYGVYRWLSPPVEVDNTQAKALTGLKPAGTTTPETPENTAKPPAKTSNPDKTGNPDSTKTDKPDPPKPVPQKTPLERGFITKEDKTQEYKVTHYNNYWEYTTSKDDVWRLAKDFKTTGWKVQVNGLVEKPMTFTLDQLRKISPLEERIYRFRCVEAWSMVIPWAGYPLSRLLEKVQPKPEAKYVAFQSVEDKKNMPNVKSGAVLPWPYLEGLTLAEAQHPLTLMALGLYGKELLPQNGAPFRLVVPWKYGFKYAKSIIRITLTSKQPPTTWNDANPRAYGFYANVNPDGRNGQHAANERRYGKDGKVRIIKTRLFNGYQEQVGSLYKDLDLNVHF